MYCIHLVASLLLFFVSHQSVAFVITTMDKAAAKELWKQPITETGYLHETSPESLPSWVMAKDLITTDATTTHITSDFPGNDAHFKLGDQLLYKEVLNDDKISYSAMVPSGDDGTSFQFLRRAYRSCGSGMNSWYWYRTTPAVEGQEPSMHVPNYEVDLTIEKPAKDKRADAPLVPLYMYGRLMPVKGVAETTSYVLVSVVKGLDPDCHESAAGCIWKDLYKIAKMSQFQYAALIFDVSTPGQSGKLVGKSEQAGTIDIRPVFDIAAGVDLFMVLSGCTPLFPDGGKVIRGVEVASMCMVGF